MTLTMSGVVTEINNESLERALADIEMLQAAYPEEIAVTSSGVQTQRFPLHVELRLDNSASSASNSSNCNTNSNSEHNNKNNSISSIILEFVDGYPTNTGVQISSYRSIDKERIDAVARAVRVVAKECLQDKIEGGLSCCATAMQTWNDYEALDKQQLNVDDNNRTTVNQKAELESSSFPTLLELGQSHYDWITGEPLIDRKSIFLAHACRVSTEHQVKEALGQLLSSSSKIQRATHNMYAWRLTERCNNMTNSIGNGGRILKHDNDDDGEDGAGSRMALLLHQRNEDGVVVVVSRWFGGIQLGPKRFAHIVNVTRDLLIYCHQNMWTDGR